MPPNSASSNQIARVPDPACEGGASAAGVLEENEPEQEPTAALLSGAGLRLKRIELLGFKSFRERTVISLPPGITAIVGPNGCGKSNIVDAIRWTLGEQSVKRLRGESMDDVVFCGNENQGPLGMAQVSVLFECDSLPRDPLIVRRDGGSPAVRPGLTEIMVTRRYFRSGESEYLVNDIPCRLRDITELFLGTGVGAKAYAIIEQGRVEQLLSAKPEEIRILIEEAAGVTLYRSRRVVAERKMERTRDNLVRVEDILREVERQINSLKRQTRKAERYRQCKLELEQLDLWLAQLERGRWRNKLWCIEVEGFAAAQALRGAEEKMTGLDQRMRDLGAELETRDTLAKEREAEAIRAQGAIARCEQERDFLRARIAAEESELARARVELEAIRGKLSEIDSEVATTRDGIDRGGSSKKEAAAELERWERSLAATCAELERLESALEAAKTATFECLAAETAARNACETAASREAAEEKERNKLNELVRQAEAEHAAAAQDSREAADTLRLMREKVEKLEGAKRQAALALERAEQERSAWLAVVEEQEAALLKARSRLESLRGLCENLEGYGEGVRRLLKRAEAQGCALLAESLEVRESLERPVAAVLGERLQYLIVEGHAEALHLLRQVQSEPGGRAAFIPRLPRFKRVAEVPSGAQRLSDLVAARASAQPVVEYLLGDVLLVSDVETALAMWRRNGGTWTFVTPAGEVVDAGGVVSGGSEERAEQRLLSQRRVVRELEQEVERAERALGEGRVRAAHLDRVVEDARQALVGIGAEVDEVALSAVRAEKDVELAGARLRSAAERLEGLELERSELEEQRLWSQEERSRAELELAEARARREQAEVALESLLSRVQALRNAREETARKLTEGKISLVKAEERLVALESRLADLLDALEDNRARHRETERRIARAEEELEEERRRLERLAGELEKMGEVHRAAVEAAHRASCEAQGTRQLLEAVRNERDSLERELRQTRQRLADIEVERTKARLGIEHLEQTIRERYGSEIPDGDFAAEGVDEEATRARVRELRESLAAMGEVGTAALEELKELEERRGFLAGQKKDLEKSLEDLQRTVVRLNRTCRERFRETFEKVKVSFESVFPRLFPGGRATLKLTDGDKPLESGVEVSVQPPGKRLGSLDLLSGGEKALTAVSLIFALFLINPSPFCILDEVDAPLDDANIGRFNALIKETSERSQFVLITHNKRTMEVADTLYGITMEEPGISKVVSVKLPAP